MYLNTLLMLPVLSLPILGDAAAAIINQPKNLFQPLPKTVFTG